MRSVCLPLLLFALLPGLAVTETVMVYVRDAEGANFITEERLESASGVETGLMNAFFEEGHIVFNAGISLDEGAVSDELMVRFARSGGARYLLFADLGEADEESQIPAKISYRYLNTEKQETVIVGELLLSDVEQDLVGGVVDRCIEYGNLAAIAVLELWHQP